MTGRERRIAELAAQDLESWARELPICSETRRDLQHTARAYRFAARAGTVGGALRAVPDAEPTGLAGEATSLPGGDRAPDRAALALDRARDGGT